VALRVLTVTETGVCESDDRGVSTRKKVDVKEEDDDGLSGEKLSGALPDLTLPPPPLCLSSSALPSSSRMMGAGPGERLSLSS
jgi:hypothetical protein